MFKTTIVTLIAREFTDIAERKIRFVIEDDSLISIAFTLWNVYTKEAISPFKIKKIEI